MWILVKAKKLILWSAFLIVTVFWANVVNGQERKVNGTEISRWIFTQYDYDIVMHIGEVTSYNRSYFSNIKAAFVPYNRTQRVVNGSCNVIKDITNNTKVDIQVLKFMSNEYRFFPISISANPCFEFASHSLGFKDDIMKVSNFAGCPIKKGYYYIKNWLPDFSKFPPYLPRGQYKMTIKNYHKSDFLIETNVYGFVKDKPGKWE